MLYVASMNCCGVRRLNQNTAVIESRTETESMLPSSDLASLRTASDVYTRNVYLTSSALTGCPSCQRAMVSMANAIDSESAAHVHLDASLGVKPASPVVLRSWPISASRSKTD